MPASGTVILQQSYNWITNYFTIAGDLTDPQVGAWHVSLSLKGLIPFYKLSFVSSVTLNILEILDTLYSTEVLCWANRV